MALPCPARCRMLNVGCMDSIVQMINEPTAAPSLLDHLYLYSYDYPSFPHSMNEDTTSGHTMQPGTSLPQDSSTVNYESEDEKEDSDLQLRWSRVMDEGKYETSSSHTKVEVLLLCWEHSCSDMATKEEIDDLKATFEDRFNYHAEIKYLDVTTRLQVHVNAIVATFVAQHDSPNTLLIVYYAGHGRPGPEFGSLELFGSVDHESRFALTLIVAGKLHQMTSKSVWISLYGTRLRQF